MTRLGGTLAAALATSLALGAPACSGEDGDKGSRGPQGPTGPSGQDGQDGQDGQNGGSGQNGGQGPEGPSGASTKWLSFADVGFARTNAEKHKVRSVTKANLNGKEIDIGYQVLLRSHQDPSRPNKECDLQNSPATCFGALIDVRGRAIRDDGGEPMVDNNNDFSSILDVGGNLFAVNAFETKPSAMFVTKLTQDPTSGTLTATATQSIDLSSIDGMWDSCAGVKSPWNTHFASEEYPYNARYITAATTWSELHAAVGDGWYIDIKQAAKYFGLDLTDANHDGDPDIAYAAFSDLYSPYLHGHPVEVAVDAAGKPTVSKHYSMGRMSIELPLILPDQKTVLISDDGGTVGFFMYVADRAGDMSAGTLYAARFYQTSAVGGGTFTADVDWVDLGHATDAAVRDLLHPATGKRVVFSDIFEVGDVLAGDTCAAGFTLTRGNSGSDEDPLECLRLKPGQELAASRLETRRYANYLGATTELTKGEGMTYDPDTRRVYFSLSDIKASMGAQRGGERQNHITVADNRCGGVFALDVGPSYDATGALVSGLAPQNIYPLLVGAAASYPAASPFAGNQCSVTSIASPDNLTYLPGYGVLIIGEDTGRHQNDVLWAYQVQSRRLTRLLTTPWGSETTSPFWLPKLGNFGYLMTVVQHPYLEDNAGDKAREEGATGVGSWMGVFGPFPALD